MEKSKSLPTKIWYKTGMPTYTTAIQHSIGSPSHSDQKNKRKVKSHIISSIDAEKAFDKVQY